MCSHSVDKLHEATQMFVMVYYVRKMTVNVGKMTVKKSYKYGEYGSVEQLLFLSCKGDDSKKVQ